MAGVCELVAVMTGGQWFGCCSVMGPMVGVCELFSVLSGGQWLAWCELVAVLSGSQLLACVSCYCSLRRTMVWLLLS